MRILKRKAWNTTVSCLLRLFTLLRNAYPTTRFICSNRRTQALILDKNIFCAIILTELAKHREGEQYDICGIGIRADRDKQKMLKLSEYTRMIDTNRGEGILLGYLRRHDNEATPIELSRALNVSTARIAVLLNKMERKNFVERQKSPNNKRNTIVKLLPAGKKLSEEQENAFNQKIISFLKTLGKERAALYVELQNEMVSFMMNNRMGDDSNAYHE